MPEIASPHIEIKAGEAVGLLVVKDKELKKLADGLFEEACAISGPFMAGMIFIKALAERAARARRDDQRAVVSRLKEVAYGYKPPGLSKKDVNDIFKQAGACGHRDPNHIRTRHIRTFRYTCG